MKDRYLIALLDILDGTDFVKPGNSQMMAIGGLAFQLRKATGTERLPLDRLHNNDEEATKRAFELLDWYPW